jgi:hypothetical protein
METLLFATITALPIASVPIRMLISTLAMTAMKRDGMIYGFLSSLLARLRSLLSRIPLLHYLSSLLSPSAPDVVLIRGRGIECGWNGVYHSLMRYLPTLPGAEVDKGGCGKGSTVMEGSLRLAMEGEGAKATFFPIERHHSASLSPGSGS